MKIARLVSEDGTVYCPVQQRSVDVLSCYGCERIADIDLDTRRPKIVCIVPAAGEPVEA